MSPLEREFHAAMLRVSEQARERGYNPTRFLLMVHKYGGVQTAKRLLAKQGDLKYSDKSEGE